jgi:hypothetical protein
VLPKAPKVLGKWSGTDADRNFLIFISSSNSHVNFLGLDLRKVCPISVQAALIRNFHKTVNVSFSTGLHSKNALAVKYLRLILRVTPDHVRATGLEIPRSNQDHIASLNPDPSLHLTSYATDSVGSVGTLYHYPIVSEHLRYNAKQLASFRKNELIDLSL